VLVLVLGHVYVHVHVHVCVRARLCVCACVRVCVCACVCSISCYFSFIDTDVYNCVSTGWKPRADFVVAMGVPRRGAWAPRDDDEVTCKDSVLTKIKISDTAVTTKRLCSSLHVQPQMMDSRQRRKGISL
jgi:hypothetical protein